MNTASYQVETLSVGQLGTNCYIVFDTSSKDAVVIDPGDDGNFIAEKILSLHIHPHAILVTHGHFDHILGVYELQEILHVPVYMNKNDGFLVQRMKESAQHFLHRTIVEQEPDITPISTKKLSFGTIDIDIIATPGHTPGGVSFVMKEADMIYTGDTLFAHGYIGRTDLSYSRPLDLADSIKTLLALPPHYTVYPGHGDSSTIGMEKKLHEKGKDV